MTVAVGLLVGEVHGERGRDYAEVWTACLALAVDAARRSGRSVPDVEVVAREVEGLPTGSAAAVVAAWEELRAAGVVAVLGPANADNGLAVVPVADAGQVPTIVFGCSERLVSAWTFSVPWGAAPEDADLAVRWCAAQGASRLGVLWDSAWHAEEWFAHGRRTAARLGIDVVADARIAALALDPVAAAEQQAAAAAGVARVLAAGADALVLMTSHAAVPFARAVGDAGFAGPRAVAGASFGAARREPALFEGWVGTSVRDDSNPVGAAFLDAYAAATGRPAPNEEMALVVHDGCRALVEGLALAPSLDPEGVRTGLERVDGLPAASGAPGTVLRFGPGDHRGPRGPALSVLRRQAGPGRDDQRPEPLPPKR